MTRVFELYDNYLRLVYEKFKRNNFSSILKLIRNIVDGTSTGSIQNGSSKEDLKLFVVLCTSTRQRSDKRL